MASMLFAMFIVAPLVLLGFNLGRGAVGLTRTRNETRDPNARRPRPLKSRWPVRARRSAPVVDPTRSLSPVAALRRGREARRSARAAARRPEREDALRPVTVLASPSPAPRTTLPVTASPRGFVPAPASAFNAGPALTPRHARDHALVA